MSRTGPQRRLSKTTEQIASRDCRIAQQRESIAGERNQQTTEFFHLTWLAKYLMQLRRKPERTNVVLPLLADHGSAVGLANATMLRGWAQVLRGQTEVGIGDVRDGLTAWRARLDQNIRPPIVSRGQQTRICLRE